LDEQRQKLIGRMTKQLRDELLESRNLWERRLLTAVTQIWGFSPFSSMLRFYNGLGSFIASMTLFRARNTAQMALIGALQGGRWLRSRQEQQQTEERLRQVSSGRTFGLDDNLLREAQLVAAGYASGARLDAALVESASLEGLRDEAARVEDQFLGDAGRKVDHIIDELAVRNSGWFTRLRYELLFLLFVGFVLYRVGKNFFYDSFLREFVGAAPAAAETQFLAVEFYIAAGVFFVLWTGLLVMLFTRRLRRGLNRRVDALASELAQGRLAQGLFPQLEQACRGIDVQMTKLTALAEATNELRSELATSPELGAPLAPRAEALAT
jgi:hypothetical protein